MSSEDVIKEIRESLNGRPGQPIVFGVCKALAERFGMPSQLSHHALEDAQQQAVLIRHIMDEG